MWILLQNSFPFLNSLSLSKLNQISEFPKRKQKMNNWVLFFVFLLSSLWFQSAQSGNVSYDGRSLLINGDRRILFSGSIHYPRSTPDVRFLIPPFLDFELFFFFFLWFDSKIKWNGMLLQMWEGLIEKAKEGGLDVIDTYVFWNLHEPSPGNVALCFALFFVIWFDLIWNLMGVFGICVCSMILRGGMIWSSSLDWCRRQGCMFIFGLGLIFVENGILGKIFTLLGNK